MSVSWTFARFTGVARAAAVLAAAVVALWTSWSAVTGPSAEAAPYPPTEPCTLSAQYRAPAGPAARYDVSGSGLGPAQPVRVVLAADERTLAITRTDAFGRFATAVTAPATPDRTAPALLAATSSRRCVWTPPPVPGPTGTGASPTGAATQPSGAPTTGPGSGGGAADGDSRGAGRSSSAGAAPTAATSGASGGATSRPATITPSAPAPQGDATARPPRAEPVPGTEPPFGIGLAIAAALLVLGTLAVLLLTRRPER